MQNLVNTLRLWVRSHSDSEKGATAVEYGLMVFLIALAIIVTVTTLGTTLDGIFGDVVAGL